MTLGGGQRSFPLQSQLDICCRRRSISIGGGVICGEKGILFLGVEQRHGKQISVSGRRGGIHIELSHQVKCSHQVIVVSREVGRSKRQLVRHLSARWVHFGRPIILADQVSVRVSRGPARTGCRARTIPSVLLLVPPLSVHVVVIDVTVVAAVVLLVRARRERAGNGRNGETLC